MHASVSVTAYLNDCAIIKCKIKTKDSIKKTSKEITLKRNIDHDQEPEAEAEAEAKCLIAQQKEQLISDACARVSVFAFHENTQTDLLYSEYG